METGFGGKGGDARFLCGEEGRFARNCLTANEIGGVTCDDFRDKVAADSVIGVIFATRQLWPRGRISTQPFAFFVFVISIPL